MMGETKTSTATGSAAPDRTKRNVILLAVCQALAQSGSSLTATVAALAVLGVGWPKVDAMIVQKRSSKTGKIITKYRNDGDAFMPGETILACPPEHGRIWNNAGKSFPFRESSAQ